MSNHLMIVHRASISILQALALKLLGPHVTRERNWSTYKIPSTKRNKMTPQRAKDLVYIHTNLHLPPRQSSICSLGGTRI